MTENFSTVQSVKFYKFDLNFYLIGVVLNKLWKKYYFDITR